MSVSYLLWRDIFKKCCHAKAFKIQNDPTRSASLINLFGLGRVVQPFKAAVKLSLEDPEIRVIAGINLPVLLQLAVDADQAVDIDGCIEQAVEEGRFCLKKVDLSKFRTC